jgi:hypothetical protein
VRRRGEPVAVGQHGVFSGASAWTFAFRHWMGKPLMVAGVA